MKNNTRKQNKNQNYRHKAKQILDVVKTKYNLSSAFTKADFERICKTENITSVEMELNGTGYYVLSRKGNYYIYIKANLCEECFIDVAAHELAHHFFGHLENLRKFDIPLTPDERRRAEIEADVFSEMLLGSSVLDAEILINILDAEVIQ